MSPMSVKAVKQPNSYTCGPASLKVALKILGNDMPLTKLTKLCRTTSNGTSTNHMLEAARKAHLNYHLLKKATLHHIKKFLKKGSTYALLVSYLYDLDKEGNPNPESGHWAVVSSFKEKSQKITLLDSIAGRRKSYNWADFRDRWLGYDIKRYYFGRKRKHYKYVKRIEPRYMVVLKKDIS